MESKRKTFLLIDDNHENFFVGKFTRTDSEIMPSLRALDIGEVMNTGNGRGIQRES